VIDGELAGDLPSSGPPLESRVFCSDDDDDKRSGAVQDCNLFPDPCANCTCRACPCEAECNEGNLAFAECIDGCLMQQGGDFLACFDGCEALATGSTREKSAVHRSCGQGLVQRFVPALIRGNALLGDRKRAV
jgi:hypothetical protein